MTLGLGHGHMLPRYCPPFFRLARAPADGMNSGLWALAEVTARSRCPRQCELAEREGWRRASPPPLATLAVAFGDGTPASRACPNPCWVRILRPTSEKTAAPLSVRAAAFFACMAEREGWRR